jgi:Spy/CpxP family protein refolding chaperone
MDIFTQKKFLIRIVILLTVLNLILITLLVLKNFAKNPDPGTTPTPSRDLSMVLKRELNLDDNQVKQIRELRKKYAEIEKTLEDAIKSERDSINAAMFNSNPDSGKIKNLARGVAENEYRMELLRFQQAEELKLICTPEQLQQFDRLIREIRDFFKNDQQPAGNKRQGPPNGQKKEPGIKRENRPPKN